MGRFGDVLEAIYAAPRLDGELHARAYQVVDVTRVRALHHWWSQRAAHGGSFGVLLATTSGEPGANETDHELWRQSGERWRADAGDHVIVLADDALLSYYPAMGGIRNAGGDRTIPGWDAVLRPRWLLSWFDIALGDDVVVAGRSCWSLSLSPAHDRPGHLLGMPRWFGTEVSAAIDQQTGIVLSYVARFEGRAADSWTTTVFEQRGAIDPTVFAFTPPDGSDFRDPQEAAHDAMLRSVTEAGIDLDGVDTNDHAAVTEAFIRHRHGSFGPIGPEHLAEQFVPKGPPPDDPEESEAAIRDTFSRIVTPSDDGAAVPAVQGGENLGPCLREAGERAPGQSEVTPTTTVDHLKFLGPDEAIVWFSLARGEQMLLPGMSGRAYRINGRWVVARETFAQIVGSVGVRCPPPPSF